LNVRLIELRLVNHLCEDFFVYKHFVCLIVAKKVVVLFYLWKAVNNFCESFFLNGFDTGHRQDNENCSDYLGQSSDLS
jgi:hypothetical protein